MFPRRELTTEGGLDVLANKQKILEAVKRLQDRGIHVSLFIDPQKNQLETAKAVGAYAVEIHTGAYCNAAGTEREGAGCRCRCGIACPQFGFEVHGGHGLNYENVLPIATIPEIVELNIGHSIIARAVIVGIEQAVREMKQLLAKARE